MCGIAGIIDLSPRQSLKDSLRTMTSLVAHRGPDDEGMALFGPGGALSTGAEALTQGTGLWTAGLGHRRLSIIDLSSAGHQPMSDATGRFWITYNGEIYNYLELRRELEGLGHVFRTRTDTEVILEAFRAWGRETLCRLNGMWAFAIYDRQQEELFLARDRFGVKPLLYTARPGFFAFASEAKQLLAGVPGPWRLNRNIAADFFFWDLQGHTTATFIDGIVELQGGHFMEVSQENIKSGALQPRRYWNPTLEPHSWNSGSTNRFHDIFQDAVRLRLRSDVPFGVTLSGGLDSSSISCVASQLLASSSPGEKIRAFTAVFSDKGYSEEVFAQAVIRQAGLQPITVRPDAGNLVRDWPAFVACMEEPFSSLSYYTNWKVYQQIHAHDVPVILNGQGGDELLMGYPRYRIPFIKFLLKQGRVADAIREACLSGKRGGMPLHLLAAYGIYFSLPTIRTFRRLRMLKPFVKKDFFMSGAERTDVVRQGSVYRDFPDLLEKEFNEYQLPHLLHHEDRVSMHFSIESRNPFLDYRLYEFVLGMKMDGLLHRGWSKYILRQAMRDILPEQVRMRTDKMGFDTPAARLLQDGAAYFSEILARNDDDPLLDTKALQQAFLRGQVQENILTSALSYLSWRESFGVRA